MLIWAWENKDQPWFQEPLSFQTMMLAFLAYTDDIKHLLCQTQERKDHIIALLFVCLFIYLLRQGFSSGWLQTSSPCIYLSSVEITDSYHYTGCDKIFSKQGYIFFCLQVFDVPCFNFYFLHVPLHICGGQRTACRSLFSPSILWVLGIEIRSSGLVASTFTLCTILLNKPAPSL